MTSSIIDYEDITLSTNVTIKQYHQFVREQNRDAIADLIQDRFTIRYILPIKGDSTHKKSKSGFAMMAICCLMIESLEIFRQGLLNSKNKSGSLFQLFLTKSTRFNFSEEEAQNFYTHIRCGILHQAESTGGWRIRRDGNLYNSTAKTINATKFLDALEGSLIDYCEQLRSGDWNDELWKNCRKKMNAICENCKP